MKPGKKGRQTIKIVFNIHLQLACDRPILMVEWTPGINIFSSAAPIGGASPRRVVELTYLSEAISHRRLHWPEPLLV